MIFSTFFSILAIGSSIFNNSSSSVDELKLKKVNSKSKRDADDTFNEKTAPEKKKYDMAITEPKLIEIRDRIINHIKDNKGSFQFISYVMKPYVEDGKYYRKGTIDSRNVKNTGLTESNCLSGFLMNGEGQFGEKGSYQRFGDFKWPEIGNNPGVPCGYNAYYSMRLPNWLLGPTPISSWWSTTYEDSGTMFHIRFDRSTHFQDFVFLYYHDEVLTNNLLSEMKKMHVIAYGE